MKKGYSALAKLCLASLVLLTTSGAFAQVMFNGAGSSAMFNTFGFAARLNTAPCGTHNWSKKGGGSAHDSRNGTIQDVTGNIWVVWDNGTSPTVICAYLNIDSGIGVRAFFAVPQNTLVLPSSWVGVAGDQLVPTPMPADEPLPAAVQAALNGQSFNAGMTDIRPEDALFATNRAFSLGYGTPPVGSTIHSEFSAKFVQPVAFSLTGPDPITGMNHTGSTVTTDIGAAPVVVFVNKTNATTGHLGNAAFKNVNRFVLGWFVNGNLQSTRDLTTTTISAKNPVHVMLREPLSGTYNTFEFNIPNSKEIATSQENNVNPSVDNPLNQTNPLAPHGTRQRVVGTGEMVAEVAATTDALGYAFWSFGNFANVVSSTKYLTVDDVDPIKTSYSNGIFPTCPAPPCTGALTFPHVADGTYPIWSVLRIATASPVPAFISTLVSAAISNSTTIPDFLPATSLKVFRSHYDQSGVAGHNGKASACSTTESGGDVGGAVYTVQANTDYCSDTGMEILQQKQ